MCWPRYIDPELKKLFHAIPKRKTNRNSFAHSPVPAELQKQMGEAAAAEGVTLTCIDAEDQRKAIAGLVSEADHKQFADPQFRRELASWIHSSRRNDGLPVYAYGISSILNNATPLVNAVVRTFDIGNNIAASHLQLAEGSPLLACISTAPDNAQTWLAVGQALERVLLVVAEAGFDASYLNQPIEVPALRSRLHLLAGGEPSPQILLRIGKAATTLASPRRPLGDVLW